MARVELLIREGEVGLKVAPKSSKVNLFLCSLFFSYHLEPLYVTGHSTNFTTITSPHEIYEDKWRRIFH